MCGVKSILFRGDWRGKYGLAVAWRRVFARFWPAAGRKCVNRNLVAPAVLVRLSEMPEQPDPDAVLMLRVKRGDRAAFTELVEKWKQPVMNFVFGTLRDETESEDVAQNTFVQVWKSRSRYERTAKFSTWLFTIARNLCLNEIRRRSRHPAEGLEESHPEHDDLPSRQYEDKNIALPTDEVLHGELAKKIEEALAELPENQRTAILLCRRDEVSYEEIAEVLGCSLSATKSIIFRGRETLKEKLKPYLQTGEWE
jgi:RNA polymerase sigma-70 factor (ECF subfamily)